MSGSRRIYLINPPSLPSIRPIRNRHNGSARRGAGLANREGTAGLGTLDHLAQGFLYPPHLLATLAALARDADYTPILLDATGLRWHTTEVLAHLPTDEDVPVVVQISHASREGDGDFLRLLRLERPRSQVMVVGPALPTLTDQWQGQDLADAYLMGEPEGAFLDALESMCEGCGTHFDPLQMDVVGYDERRRLENLDALPNPAWDLVDRKRYGFLTVLSSRGCPDGCAYCPYVVAHGAFFRSQSPLRTVEEMSWLERTHRPTHVMFRDPVFAHDRERVLAICQGLQQRGVRQSWECESRPEHFDGELLREMRAAGCTTIKVGLESTDPTLLVALKRVASIEAGREYVEQMEYVVRRCRQLGITCRLFVMTGLPGQDKAMLDETAGFLKKLRPDALHIKPYHWYPGVAHERESDEGEQQAKRLRRLAHPTLPLHQRIMRRLRR